MQNKIKIDSWHDFLLSDIFISLGTGREIIKQCNDGNEILISSGQYNNGVAKHIKSGIKKFPSNTISLAKNGCVGKCFYQNQDFYATSDVLILLNKKINQYSAFFIISVLEKYTKTFSWDNKINMECINNIFVKLPAKINLKGIFEPDWEYMEQYMKNLEMKVKHKLLCLSHV